MKYTSSIWAASLAGAAYFISLLVGCIVVLTNHAVAILDSAQPITSNLTTASKSWADASRQQAQSTVAIERDIRAEMWHVDRTLTTLDMTLGTARETIASVKGTAEAATGELAALKGTTEQITTNLTHLTPVEDSLAMDARDFDSILKDDAIHRTAEDLAGMADSGNAIMFDFRKVADKTTADYLKPVPWWKQPIQKAGALIDIGAAVARHTP